ncbi:NAD-dependent epimerase/dehydratase family protein [Wenzhouxiangella marina]|uniref:Epimerase n=1 Tax=Wenzhouxiangella marina TaxID=1579979 RepID=A0A0K0XWP3_9GAMM|nr:NAD-dependent epimerase/dehydratase family protein [Wenzhouxiangella marina]AKS42090.1 epimerase [Wenzhouxiangella marina]MBB6086140.1 nucleoside-diphosphate-sugar epimerase [Wenzhouxiangella marina]
MARIALTGASGFVGRHLLAALLEGGHEIRALVRHPEQLPGRHQLTPVRGRLDDSEALGELVSDVDAIIHLAGATAGIDYAELARVNAIGTARLAEAAELHAPGARFIHLSSLAARRPELSDYAASKRAGEDLLVDRELDWVILRAPAIYGPDDPALEPLWQALSRGWLVRTGPPRARFSLLHVDDLASALMTLAVTPQAAQHRVFELDDGHPGAYGWPELRQLATEQRGRPVRELPVPKMALRLLGHANLLLARLHRRRPPPLVPGKVRELVHHDWVCDNSGLPGCPDWTPKYTLKTALPTLPGWRDA